MPSSATVPDFSVLQAALHHFRATAQDCGFSFNALICWLAADLNSVKSGSGM